MTNCSTQNIEQTLFLGCSVNKFSCNLGFNEQPTEVNVTIVEDDCAAPDGHSKIYYDIFSTNIRKEWTKADPGLYCFGANGDEPPKLGAPVYFRFGNFEFMGLLQSWTKIQTKSDKNIYEVKLVSPVEILAGCQLIISDYTGPIKGYNIFNIYGFQEVFSPNSPAPYYTDPRYTVDGPVMGSFSGAFGGANANKIGMTWNKIKEGIQILTSSLIRADILGYGDFSQVGRIVFYGGQSNAKFGLLPYDDKNLSLGLAFGVTADLSYYYLDISELPSVPDSYRVAGPSISLLSLISQICNDFGMDYYLELVPVKQGNKVLKIIKIRTILRNIQPDTTIVQSYINAVPEVIDSSFGRELRNENTTTFLVGGQKQSIIQIDNGKPDPTNDPEESWLLENYLTEDYVRDRIVPYFGKDTYGDVYVLHTTSGSHLENGHLVSNIINSPLVYYINFDFRNRYNWVILNDLLPSTIPVTIAEMRAAEEGYDSWSFHSKAANTAFYQYITEGGYDIDSIFTPNVRNSPKIQPRDIVNLQATPVVDEFSYEIRQYVQTIAQIYTQSKRTFMVRVPWVKARYSVDSETIANSYADLDVLYTDEPCEGGWTEASKVLYLDNPSSYIDRMRNTDGTIRSFGMFDLPDDTVCTTSSGTGTFYDILGHTITGTVSNTTCASVSQTSQTISEFDTPESFAVDRTTIAGLTGSGKVLYYACTQELEPVFLDRINLISPRILIQFSQPLDFWSDTPGSIFNSNGWDLNSPFTDGKIISTDNIQNSVELELAILKANPPVKEPDRVAIALRSNLQTYGPWKPNNIIEAGPPGQIRFEKQEDLVPWAFGSYANLDDIGQLRANESVTVMTEGEVGTVTIYGVPDIPLGAELASLKGLTSKFFTTDEHLIENRIPTFSAVTLSDQNSASKTFNIPSITFGSWNGSFGPTVTSINIDLSIEGITTTYSFRTFTPRFGILSKLNAQRLEHRYEYENHRRAYLRYIDEARKIQGRYIQSLKQIGNINSAAQGDIRAQAGTPHSVLVSQLVPWDSTPNSSDAAYKRTIVATKDLYELQNNLINSTVTGDTPYNHMAIMSLDGLVRPVSITGGGGFPRLVQTGFLPLRTNLGANNYVPSPFYTFDDDPDINSPVNRIGHTAPPISPFAAITSVISPTTSGTIVSGVVNMNEDFLTAPTTIVYNYVRNIDYFNPLTNPSGHYSTVSTLHTGSGTGHDIDILARRTSVDFTGTGTSLIMPIDIRGYNSGTTRADYTDDYRFLALKGPLILHSWGYDINGKPIPNDHNVDGGHVFITGGQSYDVNTTGDGIFWRGSLSDRFLPDFLKKPETWPVAPIDLRFDRTRGVWTCPPSYPIVDIQLWQDSMTGTGTDPITTHCSGLINVYGANFDEYSWDESGNHISFGWVPVFNPSDSYNSSVCNCYYNGDTVKAYYSINDGYYHVISAPKQNPWHISIAYTAESGSACDRITCAIYTPTSILNQDGYGCGLEVHPSANVIGTCVTNISPGIVLLLHSRAFWNFSPIINNNNIYVFPLGGSGSTTINNTNDCCTTTGGFDVINLPDWAFSAQPFSSAGCGLQGNNDTISIKIADIIGHGLQVDPWNDPTVCSIAINPDALVGCGLQVCTKTNNDNHEVRIKIKPDDIAGFALKAHTVATLADPNPVDLSNNSNGPCKIQLEDRAFDPTQIQLFGQNRGNTNLRWGTVSYWLNNGLDGWDQNKDQTIIHLKGVGVDMWADAGKVKVEDPDGLEYLIDKMKDISTYDSNIHQLVYAEVTDNSPSKNIRYFTNKSSGSNSIVTVLISDSIVGATYDSDLATITPTTMTAELMTRQNDLSLIDDSTITLVVDFPDSITVPEGSGLIGKASLISGDYYQLISVGCVKVVL